MNKNNPNNIAEVVATFGKDSLVEFNGKIINTTARSATKCIVGDKVEFSGEVITKILPRRNLLANNGKNIASNIDEIFLTLAISPYPQLLSIDNYLIKAQISNIDISILINKDDIIDKKNIDKVAKIYTNIGYSVDFISIDKNKNTDILLAKTKNKVCVFVGQSGVGKSSIINFLINNYQIYESQKINELGKDGLGKHTTTSSKVFKLQNGSKVIDTPGVREFNPIDFTKDEIKQGFIEFGQFANECKFHNCWHINEPKCAIKKQLELGNISRHRYDNYLNLINLGKINRYY